jgi:predicted LPLAT superfamily acyltransferase
MAKIASARNNNQLWLEQKERSNLFTLRIIIAITHYLGRPIGRLLLHPICCYFLLFSPKAKKASKKFLTRALNRPVKFKDIYRHYHCFAACLLDRIALLHNEVERFHLKVQGLDQFHACLNQGRGCLLLGSHLGSFEVLRCLAKHHQVPVKLLMYQQNAQTMERIMLQLDPQLAQHIITIGHPRALLEVQEALAQGYVVGILGDRLFSSDKATRCDFLGGKVDFPLGPALLAYLLKVPVLLFFAVYRAKEHYDIYFEHLTLAKLTHRQQRQQLLADFTQRYADRLADHALKAPYNWFNFYDFWQQRIDP